MRAKPLVFAAEYVGLSQEEGALSLRMGDLKFDFLACRQFAAC
jgi:hypothetical protein